MSYDARKKEVLDALAKAGFDAAAQDKIRRALDAYFRQREARLTNLLELLEPGRQGPCHRAWLDKAKDAMGMTLDAFKGADAGKLWLAGIAAEEHRFFHQLQLSQVPVARDRMVRQTANLRKAMKELENKWNAIKAGDKAIDDKMKKVAEQYEELLVGAAQVAAATEKQAKERMADAAKLILKLGLKGVDLGVVEKVIEGGATALGKKLNETKSRKLEIFALLSREEQVFGTFKEARAMVAEFLEENGYPQIKDAWDDGEDAAEAIEKKMGTDGQKRDAAAFGKAMKDELKNVFSAAEKEYKEFARKHEHLFFGPLGAGYTQEVMEDDTWKQKSSNWKRRREDFDDLLRERTLTASPDQLLEVSLEGLAADDQRRVYETLKGSCQRLLRVWNELKDFSDDPYWMLESREQLRSLLAALR